jgi:tetratricopeptide (TPR) repeat protein
MLPSTSDPEDKHQRAERSAIEAKAFAETSDWEAARKSMTSAIDDNPNSALFHALMAWYTHQCRSVPEFERQRLAEHHLAVALEIDPQNHEAHYLQGLVWAGGGNTTRARIALTTALKVRPDFTAAQSALDRLGGKLEDEAAPPREGTLATPRRNKRTLVLPLMVGTVLVGLVAGGAFLISGERNTLAKEIGTSLTLVSASRVDKDLYIDFGEAWSTLADKHAEVAGIAQHLGQIGLVNAFVYSNSNPVAEIHDQIVCIEAECAARLTQAAPRR